MYPKRQDDPSQALQGDSFPYVPPLVPLKKPTELRIPKVFPISTEPSP
jgi:hypothetical protein